MSLRFFVVVGLVSLFVGCGKAPAPAPVPEQQSDAKQPSDKKTPSPTATYKVKAEDLAAEFKKDEAAAIAKYSGASVEVSGVVLSIGLATAEDALVGLRQNPADKYGSFGIVMKGRDILGKLGKQQDVTIRCTWKQELLLRGFADGELITKGPDTAVRMTAEKFAQQFAADPAGLEKMCKDRTIILEGVVESGLESVGVGGLDGEFRLKGDGKIRIRCGVQQPHKKLIPTPVPGKTVTVVGEWRYAEEGKEVELWVVF
jgi:hypothetical protein